MNEPARPLPDASSADIDISGLTADSRAVEPGFLFAALPGVRTDGLRFIPDALAREYLTSNIVNDLGPLEYEGLELYLRYAREALVAV